MQTLAYMLCQMTYIWIDNSVAIPREKRVVPQQIKFFCVCTRTRHDQMYKYVHLNAKTSFCVPHLHAYLHAFQIENTIKTPATTISIIHAHTYAQPNHIFSFLLSWPFHHACLPWRLYVSVFFLLGKRLTSFIQLLFLHFMTGHTKLHCPVKGNEWQRRRHEWYANI